MKIVHVIPALTKGGGERVAVELANHAVREGHTVAIVAHHAVDPCLLQATLDDRVEVLFISRKDQSRLLSSLHWIRKNRSWILGQDILHCHLTYGSFFGTFVGAFRALSRNRRLAIVETYHAVGMAIPSWHRWIHARLAAGRDGLALMAEDPFWNNFRKKHPSIVTKTILNGVSVSHLKPPTETERKQYLKQLSIPDNCEYIVGTVGMLRPDRQPWRYVSIFEEVIRKRGASVHFIIGGDGPEMEKVKLMAKQSSAAANIHFAGLVNNPAIPFSVMDLYVSLSVRNAVGVSMFEAALSHLPVVGLQVIDDYRATPTDWVWSSPNDREVAERICNLLENKDERKRLSEYQYQYALNNHSTEAMAKAYYLLYDEIMQLKNLKTLNLKHGVK